MTLLINGICIFYTVSPEVRVIMAEPRIWQDIVYNTSLEIEITNQVVDPSIINCPQSFLHRDIHWSCKMSVVIET